MGNTLPSLPLLGQSVCGERAKRIDSHELFFYPQAEQGPHRSRNDEQGTMGAFLTSIMWIGIGSLPAVFLFVVLAWAGVLRTLAPILLFRGVLLSFIAAALHSVLLIVSGIPVVSVPPIAAATVVVGWALNLTFLVVLPVTIDRSVTVYLLGRLSHADKGLSHQELRDSLVSTFVDEFDGVGRRMGEQVTSGNVISSEGRFALTPKGATFVRFGRAVGRLFGADMRFVGR